MSARRSFREIWPFLLSVTLIWAAGLGLSQWLLAGLPSVEHLPDRAATPSSKLYDRHGRLLFEIPPPHSGLHSPIPLDEIPPALVQATLSTEDAGFYHHPGVDLRAISRALWTNLRGGEIRSGASTITQQVVRTLLLSPEERQARTLRRKAREMLLAWELTRTYTKDEILSLYLNETYYGNMAYGVEAAAQAYFGKHVRDLDLAESALLAGLPQAPTHYNPLENLAAAKERQAAVLDLMVKQDFITPEQARLAREEKLAFAAAPFPIEAPHFVMYVRARLEEELGLDRLEQGGLRIYTTLDLDMNVTARDIARRHLERLATCHGRPTGCPPGGHNVRNAALVALDPHSGQILAMVGSPDYFAARIDGAVNGTTALRQPGSSIKPITYAAAFEEGTMTPATMLLDVRTAFVTKEGEPYIPINYDLQYRGPVRLREALASSYNLIAVKVLDQIGIEHMTGLARRLGITTFDDSDRFGLAITLGGGEVRLLELTGAYAALANGGRYVSPSAIVRVENAAGEVIWQPAPPAGRQVLDERVAYLISDILSDDLARLPSFGLGSVLELSRPAAVKTGTTTDYRDNWTVGYTPNLVVGVWAGNADNEPMWEASGISGAAPIWHDLMEIVLKGRPVAEFERPEGLVEVEVCALSGLLPEPDCPHRVTERFIAGTEPAAHCTMHQYVAIDRRTGLRATADTPPEWVVQRVHTTLPAEAQEWARQHSLLQPPPDGKDDAPDPLPLADDAPLVMTHPDAGASYKIDPTLPRDAQKIVVSARPGTASALQEVTLFLDGQELARFTHPPYQVLWQLQPGEHAFWAEGVDGEGRVVRSGEVTIRVKE